MNPPSQFIRSIGPAMPSIEEAVEHQTFRRPGRLAPKWLEDLISGQLNDEPEITWPMTCGCGQTNQRHELLSLGHQSITAESNAGSDCFKETLSCICQHCRFQFVIDVETLGNVKCGLPNNYQDLFHHFVWRPSTETTNSEHTKYYPVLGHVEYQCSAPNCGTVVKVEVVRPRLTAEHTDFLLDLEPVKERKAQAMAEDPAKYGGISVDPPHSLLWRYVKGVVAGDVAEDKKIAKQNKLFRVQFGDSEAARDLLTYLEFEEIIDGQSWNLPRPEINKPTPLGTQLAFLQNVKSELEALNDRANLMNLKPFPVLGVLKKTLHIEQEASTRVAGEIYNESDYQTLGITPNTHESVFWFAFSCQRQTDPDNTDTYLGAVRRLAVGRGDEDLEMRITTFESMRSMPQQQEEDEDLRRAIELSHADKPASVSPEEKVTIAYKHFGFEFPPLFPDLRMAFDQKCASSPDNRIDHINKLALIGHFSKDAQVTALAKKSVTLDDAWKFLQEAPGTDHNIIETKAFNMESFHTAGETEGGELPILLAALQRIAVSDPQYEPLRQTGAIINARSGTNYDTQVTASPILEEAVDVNMPVGLQNIRNTCYLNSILQYLFTVHPVRDIVLTYDQYRLENTVEHIANRRIVARSLGAGDPYAGQEFVRELGSFFQELMDATTRTIKPKQRLALAAFKSAELLENDGAEMLKAPPLPPRPTEAAPVPSQATDGLNITVTSVAGDDNLDGASMVSSQTLANGNSEQGFVSIGRDGAAHDVVMETTEQPQEKRRMSTDSALDLADFEDVVDLPRVTLKEDVTMVDNPPPIPPTEEVIVLEPTLEEKIARALDDDRVTGTAQEDVSEVIGTVINHLHAAIKPTGIDPVTKTQEDVLTDTFYYTGVSTKKKRTIDAQQPSQQVAITRTLYKERTMTAYPDEHKTISLVDALDRTFAREYISDSNLELYQSIVKLPPILHIQIQRTKPDSGKINTPIDIPQVLYLDRYMDADTQSELFKKRKRSWNITEKLQAYASGAAAPQVTADQIDEQTLAEYQRATIEEHMRDDPDDDITILDPALTSLIDEHGIERPPAFDIEMKDQDSAIAVTKALRPDFIVEFEKRESEKAEKLREDLIREHAQLFDTLQEHKYLLHAVICHQGITGKSGHYWIYIYDFQHNIWRKYNDMRVEEWDNTEKLLETLRSNGEPYYLSYVRADSTDIVSIPSRRFPAADAPASQDQEMPDLVDVDN